MFFPNTVERQDSARPGKVGPWNPYEREALSSWLALMFGCPQLVGERQRLY
jgi:hypothetical protein